MGMKFDRAVLAGKKVGLALSGGAARGLAHIGVLRVLEKEGIPIDLIAGTSAGAIIGAAYAWNQDISWITRVALDAKWKKWAPLLDPSFPKSGLLKGRKIKDLLSSYIGGNIKFSNLKIPFKCVASDIDSGEEIVIDSGPVAEAIRASISIPGIFSVVKYEGRYLVDGGLTTPVPVNVVKDMGADFIIAVNVNPDVSGRLGKTSQKRVEARKEPNIFQVMMQSIYITTYSLAWSSLSKADVVIEPDLAHIGAGEFRRVRELIKQGREAARDAMPEIKRKLEGL
jgi:NTE family protein